MIVQIIAPLLQIALYICTGTSILLLFERGYMAIVIMCQKSGNKRYTEYQLDAIKDREGKKELYDGVGSNPNVS